MNWDQIKKIKFIFLCFAFLLVGGCAVQGPIEMDFSRWQSDSVKSVAIYVKAVPEGYTHKAGNQGLLDIAINNAAASDLTKHVKTLDFSEFYVIKDQLQNSIERRDINVSVLSTDYEMPELEKFEKEGNFASKDYSVLKDSLAVDQLLIIQVNQVGTIRNYYGFIPVGAPSAYFSGLGQLIDLSTNEILWHKPVVVQKPVKGWDEPPSYPGLTNVIYQTLDQGRSELVSPFVAP